ncbi:hypothetical protein ACFFGV_18610 [Pontibacillus salicampi]|uniref:Uncharacterized protein n=1 Tax=Pontibacillus salicampi TaxID=1449801 RepID=A0ABV6LTN3_9BACI
MPIFYVLLGLIVFGVLVFIIRHTTVRYRFDEESVKMSYGFSKNAIQMDVKNIRRIYDVGWDNIPNFTAQLGSPGRDYTGLVFEMKDGSKYLIHIENCGKLLQGIETANPNISFHISPTFNH